MLWQGRLPIMPRQIITKITKLEIAHDTNEVQIFMKKIIGTVAFCIALFGYPCNAQAQFWAGFLQGLCDGIQNLQRQQTYSQQQTYNRQQKYKKEHVSELQKDTKKEKDGFVWKELSTWNGEKSINYGAQDSEGNTLIPQKYDLLYYSTSDGGYFLVKLNGKEGIYAKDGHCICDAIYDDVLYYKKGNDIYVKVERNGELGIIDKNGNYIITPNSAYKSLFYSSTDNTFNYRNASDEYVSTGIDIHGNRVLDEKTTESATRTQTIARTDNSKNPNNNKFWFPRYANVKMDEQGNPIKSAIRYVYPTEGAKSFEIEFVYKENDSNPVFVYLNEINEGSKIVKSELIAAPFKSVRSSVKYKANSVNIYSPKYHISVSSSGTIIIYNINNGSYANGNAKFFKPNEIAEVIYKARYDILIENLKKYF